MNFIIRDDDLNYFSTPEDIEWWYEEIFEMGIPVNFSTIPFVKPTSDVYTGDREKSEKEYPISENKELIEYIKNHDLIYIMQHGCTHETKSGVFEYASNDYEGLLEKTRRGKKELEQAFEQKIDVFVPPHNQLSNKAILAIEKNQLNIIRSRAALNFLPRKEYLFENLKILLHKLMYKKNKMPAYPSVINFKKHKEAFAHRLQEDNIEHLMHWINYFKNKNSFFILTNHLHSKINQRKQFLKKLTRMDMKLNIDFSRSSKLF